MAGCSSLIKVFMFVIGLVFWAAAAGLFFIGGWVFDTYKHYDELTTSPITLIPASIILAVGVFMFIIGIMSCVAAARESRCLLAVFFSLVLMVLIFEVAAGVLGYVYRYKIKSDVEEGLELAIEHYNVSYAQHQIDYLQEQLHCCGIHNASDWKSSPFWDQNQTVPSSCCIDQMCFNDTEHGSRVYQRGCLDLLENLFLDNLIYVAACAIAFAVLQFLGLICSCILMCRTKEVPYQTLISSSGSGGLRV